MKKKIISKYSPGLISLLLMAQGACVPQKTPVSLSAKPAVTQRAPQDFIYPKIQITNTKGEIKILQARPLTAEEENMPEPAPFSIKKISHAEMVYGQYVGKDYGDAMAVDVYVEQGTTSQIRSKILGNTCGVNWVMTYVEDPFTATDNYMYGGQRKRISTYISNIDTLKNSSWTYRIEDVLDSSVAYDFPVTLYNGSDAYCGGNPSPSPSPSPSSNPSPTPSPSANPTPSPTPSPIPTIVPPGEQCSSCTPNSLSELSKVEHDLNDYLRKLTELTGDTDISSGDFSVQSQRNHQQWINELRLKQEKVDSLESRIEDMNEYNLWVMENYPDKIDNLREKLENLKETKNRVQKNNISPRQDKIDRIHELTKQINQFKKELDELESLLSKSRDSYVYTNKLLLSGDPLTALVSDVLKRVENCLTGGCYDKASKPSTPPINLEKLRSCVENTRKKVEVRFSEANGELKQDWDQQKGLLSRVEKKLSTNSYTENDLSDAKGRVVEAEYALATNNLIRTGVKKRYYMGDERLLISLNATEIDIITGVMNGQQVSKTPERVIEVKSGGLQKFYKMSKAHVTQAQKHFDFVEKIRKIHPDVKMIFAYDQAEKKADPEAYNELIRILVKEAEKAGYSNFNPEQDLHSYQSVLTGIDEKCFY